MKEYASASKLPSGVYRAQPTAVGAIAQRLEAPDRVTVSLLGATDRQTLFGRFSDAFGFPEWFGRNWDAMEDCLTDLSWRPDADRLVVIEGGAELLEHAPIEAEMLLEVLRASAAQWREAGPRFVALWLDAPREFELPCPPASGT